MTPKVTNDVFQQFLKDYSNGQFTGERLGQAFMGKFAVTEPCPEIFYEVSYFQCLKLISDKYVLQAGQTQTTETESTTT